MERIWHRTMSDSDRTTLNSQVYTRNRLMSNAKSDYYTKQFPKIYGIHNSLLYYKSKNLHLSHTALTQDPRKFLRQLSEK